MNSISQRGDGVRVCYGDECHLPDLPRYVPEPYEKTKKDLAKMQRRTKKLTTSGGSRETTVAFGKKSDLKRGAKRAKYNSKRSAAAKPGVNADRMKEAAARKK
jgi:hypothetical protein